MSIADLRRPSLAPVAIACALLLVCVAGMRGDLTAAAQGHGKTSHVVEHAITDTVVDIGPPGDSLGDQLAFGNPVYDANDQQRVGRDSGNCVRTVVGKQWECYWTTFLPGGQITVEGPFYDSGQDSTLAITGGTGAYADVGGELHLHARNARGSEYDFVFSLS